MIENDTRDNAVNNDEVETVEATLEKPEEKKDDSVPLATFLELKKESKEMKAQLAALQQRASEDNMSKAEISSNLQSIAAQHNIDPQFLTQLAGAIRNEAKADLEESLKPIREKEKQEGRERAFNTYFNKALENMPEYKDVVNAEVIRQMAFNPANAKKTYAQLIEEAYGNALGGKRTLEPVTPNAKVSDNKLDYSRARSDPSYFKEVMADPELKREYNSQIEKRIQF